MRIRLPRNWTDTIAGLQLDDEHAYAVGSHGVTEIVPEMMDLGAYGIAWFRVLAGGRLVARVNATQTKAVIYAEA
ncbi:MAG: hypothetical protein M0R06_05235 [Sphaerochaeta sp.]|jgi:hypothetical protein|nr:hypothetical protein [Sphaerochaeta sp.]